jgi:UDP-N-acetylglucosamine 2-epimerase (non-hydrolysing)
VLKVLSVFGTRPEAIKMAPVVREFARDRNARSLVCLTAQHREMLDAVLEVFSLAPDFDLNVMAADQPLNAVLGRMITGLDGVMREAAPDIVLVQGDTATCLAGALAAFNLGLPVGHVEAGLRTDDLEQPFPEEGNRQMVSRLSSLHFAPTETAAANLRRERPPRPDIHVTGNTVIDALFMAVELGRNRPDKTATPELPDDLLRGRRPFILVTGHRRENFGEGFQNICRALRRIALERQDISLVYPVHLNPNVQKPVRGLLADLPNVHLIAPQPYLAFINLMRLCRFILTDSGGIQEEAPSLGKPVLVMRAATERPEAVEAGASRLVGTDCDGIVEAAAMLLTDPEAYEAMSGRPNPYGDGRAAERIGRIVRAKFS